MGCFQLKSDLCVLKIYLMVFFLKLKILPPYNNIINVKKKKSIFNPSVVRVFHEGEIQ